MLHGVSTYAYQIKTSNTFQGLQWGKKYKQWVHYSIRPEQLLLQVRWKEFYLLIRRSPVVTLAGRPPKNSIPLYSVELSQIQGSWESLIKEQCLIFMVVKKNLNKNSRKWIPSLLSTQIPYKSNTFCWSVCCIRCFLWKEYFHGCPHTCECRESHIRELVLITFLIGIK